MPNDLQLEDLRALALRVPAPLGCTGLCRAGSEDTGVILQLKVSLADVARTDCDVPGVVFGAAKPLWFS
jgi:hypothetical protein